METTQQERLAMHEVIKQYLKLHLSLEVSLTQDTVPGDGAQDCIEIGLFIEGEPIDSHQITLTPTYPRGDIDG